MEMEQKLREKQGAEAEAEAGVEVDREDVWTSERMA